MSGLEANNGCVATREIIGRRLCAYPGTRFFRRLAGNDCPARTSRSQDMWTRHMSTFTRVYSSLQPLFKRTEINCDLQYSIQSSLHMLIIYIRRTPSSHTPRSLWRLGLEQRTAGRADSVPILRDATGRDQNPSHETWGPVPPRRKASPILPFHQTPASGALVPVSFKLRFSKNTHAGSTSSSP